MKPVFRLDEDFARVEKVHSPEGQAIVEQEPAVRNIERINQSPSNGAMKTGTLYQQSLR